MLNRMVHILWNCINNEVATIKDVVSDWTTYCPEYVSIYRSILNILYWPIYDSRILTDICNFFKNVILIDICRNFSFFDRYMQFLFSKFLHISVEIWYKILIFSYIGQYNIISADICLHIPIIYVFIYRAL